MTDAEYERRSKAIDAWARAQYAAGVLPEWSIERRVEAMFDALDEEYAGPDTSYRQTRDSVDADDAGAYPGWYSLQSATRDSW